MRRFVGPICLFALAALVFEFGLVDHSASASFPLPTDGGTVTSAPFRGEGGRYLVTLEMDAIGDRHHTSCLLGGDHPQALALTNAVDLSTCDMAPAISVGWTLRSGA